jgi:hypothetical protein
VHLAELWVWILGFADGRGYILVGISGFWKVEEPILCIEVPLRFQWCMYYIYITYESRVQTVFEPLSVPPAYVDKLHGLAAVASRNLSRFETC